jgi:hypothetical protein
LGTIQGDIDCHTVIPQAFGHIAGQVGLILDDQYTHASSMRLDA